MGEPNSGEGKRGQNEGSRDEDLTRDFDIDELDVGMPGKRRRRFGGQPLLPQWKKNAVFRRVKLTEELLQSSPDFRRVEKLQLMLNNFEGRINWLQARLEHLLACQAIVKTAVNWHNGEAPGGRPGLGGGPKWGNPRREHPPGRRR